MSTLKLLGSALLAGVMLAACGGGGSGGTPPLVDETAVPDDAIASPQALTEWAKSQPVRDNAEPLNADKMVNPPVSDDTEPVSLD